MKSALIMFDVYPRAAVAAARALKARDVRVHLSLDCGHSARGVKGGFERGVQRLTMRMYGTNPILRHNTDSEEEFISSLRAISEAIGPYTLLPFGERLVRWAARNKALLQGENVVVPTVDAGRYDLVSDKKSFVKLCADFGIATPGEIDLQQLRQGPFRKKMVVKPKRAHEGGKILTAPFLIENERGFRKLQGMNLDDSEHFAQEYINGPSVYYCALYEDGRLRLRFSQVNLHQQPAGGSVVKAMPFCLPANLVFRIDAMFGSLRWNGVMMMELKMDAATGVYFAIETNARFWGPLQLCIDNGMNFPAALLGLEGTADQSGRRAGYLWIGGYLLGLRNAVKSRTKFQLFPMAGIGGIRFRDVWFRRDTFPYFFYETLVLMAYLLGKDLFSLMIRRPLNWLKARRRATQTGA